MPGKVQYSRLSAKQRSEMEREWRRLLGELPNQENVINLLGGLLLPSERIMLSRRLQIVRRLLAGHSHLRIKSDLQVGIATIERVDQWLEQHFEEYKSVLAECRETRRLSTHGKTSTDNSAYTFNDLRKKYPAEFGIINAFIDM